MAAGAVIPDSHIALAQMAWPQADKRLAESEVAIVPVGAVEQHGPNLSLETDALVAYRLSLEIARAVYPRAVVAPLVPLGVSQHHMAFPGTLTLSAATFQQVVFEEIDSLRRHGVRRFFIVDGHAGNQGALDVLVGRLRFELGVQAAYLFYFTIARDVIEQGVRSARWGHACEVETSVALHLAPELVMEQREAGALLPNQLPFSNPLDALRLGYPLDFAELTANGALGDARVASAEFGKQICDAVVARSASFLENFVALDGLREAEMELDRSGDAPAVAREAYSASQPRSRGQRDQRGRDEDAS